MLRKFFIILFLFVVGSLPAFAWTESGGFASGECDYARNGMRCGGSIDGCPTNSRCAAPNGSIRTEYKSNGTPVYVGTCDASQPCTNDRSTILNVFDEGCGTTGNIYSPNECAFGTRLVNLFVAQPSVVGSYMSPTNCSSSTSSYCYAFPPPSGTVKTTYFKCVTDASCTVAEEGCDYTETPANTGCLASESCIKTAIYDDDGNVTGYLGVCSAQDSECTGAPGNSAVCSTSTGCALGEYCASSSLWLTNDYCYPVVPSIPNPASCFASSGQECGTAIPMTPSATWPSSLGDKTVFCENGLSCVQYNTSTNTITKAAPGAFQSYSNITSGDCIDCKGLGATCTGDTSANGLIDDCCDLNARCGADKKCSTKPTTTDRFCSGQIPNPGAVCKIFGSVEDYCSLCPLAINGVSTRTASSGDIYCMGSADSSDQDTITCTDDCGCATGTCNNGICATAGSCVSPGLSCQPGIDTCCNPNPDIPFTCGTYGSSGNIRCFSPICEQVAATGNCTEETESCCPASAPFCNDGVCGEAFECTSEGECCPGFGEVCNADKQCEPAGPGECAGEDNPLPPAPGYLGPQITIQQLFSAIGAILYPAGIGIGLFFIIRAGYVIMMSEGNPDEVKRGQEHLTSAIIGTLFIVLSTAILRVIINTLLG